MGKFKIGDQLRVVDTDRSGGYFEKGQVVTVTLGDLQSESDGAAVVLLGHNGVWTEDQFELAPAFPTEPVKPRGSDLIPATEASVRTFGTGATRDLDANKLDYEGFLSPLVLKRYAEHMHKARKMADGTMRASDNWQLGIPKEAYMKSMWRHFYDVWSTHRGGNTGVDLETELCALLFNVNGYLHEELKSKCPAK